MPNIELKIYFDFACPFVYNAAVWLDMVKKNTDKKINIEWRHFSLQQNASTEEGFQVWEAQDLKTTRSLMAAIAGEAARRQGEDLFQAFLLKLLLERNGPKRIPLNDNEVFLRIAGDCGLDLERFKKDLSDISIINIIRQDHEEAVKNHGVFGTPTYIFENGQGSFVKMFIPPENEALEAFDEFIALFGKRNYFGEIKRPQPPWPKGAI